MYGEFFSGFLHIFWCTFPVDYEAALTFFLVILLMHFSFVLSRRLNFFLNLFLINFFYFVNKRAFLLTLYGILLFGIFNYHVDAACTSSLLAFGKEVFWMLLGLVIF